MSTLMQHFGNHKMKNFRSVADPILLWKFWDCVLLWMGRTRHLEMIIQAPTFASWLGLIIQNVFFPDLSHPYHMTITGVAYLLVSASSHCAVIYACFVLYNYCDIHAQTVIEQNRNAPIKYDRDVHPPSKASNVTADNNEARADKISWPIM